MLVEVLVILNHEIITKMLNGDLTPEETVKMLADEANKILK